MAAAGQESAAQPKRTRAIFPVLRSPFYCSESLEILDLHEILRHECRRFLALSELPDGAEPKAMGYAELVCLVVLQSTGVAGSQPGRGCRAAPSPMWRRSVGRVCVASGAGGFDKFE